MRALLVVTAALLLLPASAGAERRAYPVEITWKFFRGIVNVVESPIEIPVNAYKEASNASLDGGNLGDQSVGLLTGTVTGLGYGLARIGVGVFDVLTFPVPTLPVMHPDVPHGFLETIWSERSPSAITSTAPERHHD